MSMEEFIGIIRDRYDKLGTMYQSTINFIRNVWKYRRFLKKDSWWDYHFIFEMLRDKLNYDLEMYRTKSFNARPEPIIKSLNLCVNLLNRLIKDNYFDNAFLFYEKKYPDWYLYENLFCPNISQKEKDRTNVSVSIKCLKRADAQKIQDVQYLFKIMSKHILTWWD